MTIDNIEKIKFFAIELNLIVLIKKKRTNCILKKMFI